MRYCVGVLVLLLLFRVWMTGEDSGPWWTVQTKGLDTNLRGVSVRLDKGSNRAGIDRAGTHRGAGTHNRAGQHYIVWASGSNGVILRSVDDGKTWKQLAVAGGGELDFRDIEAFDADVAYVLSSGDGDKSRIYKTVDGGKTWKLQYSDKRPGFFLDALACSSRTHCVALSDPVGGKFLVLSTEDGEHWSELPRDRMPAALPGEGAFAASGTALALCEGGIYFGTGGPKARVFHTADSGRTWSVVETPIASGNASSGVFSLACSGSTLVAVGGDYKEPGRADRVAIFSGDGGATWQLAAQQPGGYRSAVGEFGGDYAAVGPNGTDVSKDHGMHWQHIDRLNLNAVSFASADGGWAVGPQGTIARFKTH